MVCVATRLPISYWSEPLVAMLLAIVCGIQSGCSRVDGIREHDVATEWRISDLNTNVLPRAGASQGDIDTAASNIIAAIREYQREYGSPVNWAISAAKTNATSEALRQWALEVLGNGSASTKTDGCWGLSEVPILITRLHPGGGVPLVLVYPAAAASNGCVQLTWGGALASMAC